MAHVGLFLFLITLCLAAISGLLFPDARRRAKQPGRFDIRATAEERAITKAGFDAAVFMRITVSLLVLGAALFIILSKQYDGDQQKWAFGAIGTVLGYWLKV